MSTAQPLRAHTKHITPYTLKPITSKKSPHRGRATQHTIAAAAVAVPESVPAKRARSSARSEEGLDFPAEAAAAKAPALIADTGMGWPAWPFRTGCGGRAIPRVTTAVLAAPAAAGVMVVVAVFASPSEFASVGREGRVAEATAVIAVC